MTADHDPPLHGRVALITGTNTGIGRITALELASRGAHVFIACRSQERTQPVLDEIRAAGCRGTAEWVPLDLGDFDSVRQCAQSLLSRNLPLHLLINNAGLAGARGVTRSGFELAFGVNHMGHFLLTQLLFNRIKRSAPARFVTVASRAHYRAPGFDWNALRETTRTVTGFPEYRASKLANVMFSAELGRRLAGSGVTTYAVHPGVVASDIWRKVPWPFRALMKLTMISPQQGAATPVHCAVSPELAQQTALYYDQCRTKEPSAIALDSALAAELWQRSEDWVR